MHTDLVYDPGDTAGDGTDFSDGLGGKQIARGLGIPQMLIYVAGHIMLIHGWQSGDHIYTLGYGFCVFVVEQFPQLVLSTENERERITAVVIAVEEETDLLQRLTTVTTAKLMR